MTLHSPDLFDEDKPAGFDGVFDWDYLCPAFFEATGRAIQPMDIDAHVEIGGHHLIFETKRDGVEVKPGQVKALLQLWAKGYHTVVFLWGKVDPMECQIFYPSGRRQRLGGPAPRNRAELGAPSGKREVYGPAKITREQLREFCFKWAKWAESHKAPFQYDGRLDEV